MRNSILLYVIVLSNVLELVALGISCLVITRLLKSVEIIVRGTTLYFAEHGLQPDGSKTKVDSQPLSPFDAALSKISLKSERHIIFRGAAGNHVKAKLISQDELQNAKVAIDRNGVRHTVDNVPYSLIDLPITWTDQLSTYKSAIDSDKEFQELNDKHQDEAANKYFDTNQKINNIVDGLRIEQPKLQDIIFRGVVGSMHIKAKLLKVDEDGYATISYNDGSRTLTGVPYSLEELPMTWTDEINTKDFTVPVESPMYDPKIDMHDPTWLDQGIR